MKQLQRILLAILLVFGRLFALPTSAAWRRGGFNFLPVFCIIALILSAPAAAGWKENFLSGLSEITQNFGKGSHTNIPHGLFSGVSGVCMGVAAESGRPVPEATISEILRVHKILLQGKRTEEKHLHNIGKLCLDYAESILRQEGASDADIEAAGKAMVNFLLPRLRAGAGLLPKP